MVPQFMSFEGGAGIRVLVLKGGPDAEREVSLRSGTEVAAALREAGFAVEEVAIDRPGLAELRAMRGDVVFPVLHGAWGEGGPLQELLEADGRPYVGARPAAARASSSLRKNAECTASCSM